MQPDDPQLLLVAADDHTPALARGAPLHLQPNQTRLAALSTLVRLGLRLPLRALVVGACLGFVHCEDKSELKEPCDNFCIGLACSDSVANVSKCSQSCVSRMNDAEEISDDCAEHYGILVECIGDLGHEACGAADEWNDFRGTRYSYPCKEVTVAYMEACPDLWFSAEP